MTTGATAIPAGRDARPPYRSSTTTSPLPPEARVVHRRLARERHDAEAVVRAQSIAGIEQQIRGTRQPVTTNTGITASRSERPSHQ